MPDYVWQIRVDGSSLESVLRLDPLPTHMLLVFRKGGEQDSSFDSVEALEERFRELFRKSIVDELDVRSWPGTRLSKGKARVFVVKLNEETSRMLLSTEADIRNWVHPKMPEDLCLFDLKAKHPRFMSVTHEELAWIIDSKEPSSRKLGPEALLDKEMLDELIISNGRYFCET